MMTQQFTENYNELKPDMWADKLKELISEIPIVKNITKTDYEGEIKSAGDTVNILTPGEITVSSLHGDALSYSDVAPEAQTLVIDQKKFFAFKINDVANAQANIDLMEAYLVNAKIAIEVVLSDYITNMISEIAQELPINSKIEDLKLKNVYMFKHYEYLYFVEGQPITLALEVTKIENIRDINSFSDLVRGLCLYGAKLTGKKAIYKIRISENDG